MRLIAVAGHRKQQPQGKWILLTNIRSHGNTGVEDAKRANRVRPWMYPPTLGWAVQFKVKSRTYRSLSFRLDRYRSRTGPNLDSLLWVKDTWPIAREYKRKASAGSIEVAPFEVNQGNKSLAKT